jgi:hypothetical protein
MYSARLEEICIAINTLFGAVHDGNDPFVHFFTTPFADPDFHKLSIHADRSFKAHG